MEGVAHGGGADLHVLGPGAQEEHAPLVGARPDEGRPLGAAQAPGAVEEDLDEAVPVAPVGSQVEASLEGLGDGGG